MSGKDSQRINNGMAIRQFCGNVLLSDVFILLISRYPHEFDLHPEIVGDADIMLTNDFLGSLSLKDTDTSAV